MSRVTMPMGALLEAVDASVPECRGMPPHDAGAAPATPTARPNGAADRA